MNIITAHTVEDSRRWKAATQANLDLLRDDLEASYHVRALTTWEAPALALLPLLPLLFLYASIVRAPIRRTWVDPQHRPGRGGHRTDRRRLRMYNAVAVVQSVTDTAFDGATTNTTGTLGATPTQNNVLVIGAVNRDGVSGQSYTAPTGWTINKQAAGDGADFYYGVFVRLAASSSPTSYTYTYANSSFTVAAFLIEFSGNDTTNIATAIDASNTATDRGFNNTQFTESITTATDGAMHLAFCFDAFSPASTSTGDATEQCDINGIQAYTRTQATAGSSSIVITPSTWNHTSYSIAIKPAGGGAATTRGTPFGNRSTAFNGGRTFMGPIHA